VSIVGIGTEIVECVRIRQMIDEHGEQFLNRVFTEQEIRFCQARRQSTEHFAARWAGKMAVARCLGSSQSMEPIWADIDITTDLTNQSEVKLRGPLLESLKAHGNGRILLTMAHCRAYATATAIAITESLQGKTIHNEPLP